MKVSQVKIIKIGNSYGVRLNKAAMTQHGIHPGDSVNLNVSVSKKNSKRAISALAAIAKMNGTLANIDVKQWEADRRDEQLKRDNQLRDITGR
ncbi:MAG: AbrB/MazE/SpoVT family DNA-binding domain-containing protein [Candidatus Saccharimonadales bacterium]